jgi:hypothetical protein
VRNFGSSGEAVFVDEAAEAIASFDLSLCGGPLVAAGRVRRSEVEGAARSVRVVVVGEDVECVLEVATVEDEEPVEAFAEDLADGCR